MNELNTIECKDLDIFESDTTYFHNGTTIVEVNCAIYYGVRTTYHIIFYEDKFIVSFDYRSEDRTDVGEYDSFEEAKEVCNEDNKIMFDHMVNTIKKWKK